jgi:hypothetical protein
VRRALLAWIALCAAGSLWPAAAAARVERYAVLIGNDLGQSDERPLRYATSDAARMYEVLHELGDFEPMNMVLLRNESGETVRRTLLNINARVREAVSRADTDVLLLVYYSGHADVDDLHLGKSSLPVQELAQFVRGSAADFRLVILDACRSGGLTRLKGGRVVDPFALPQDRLPSDGLAFLTSASHDEDAQESDVLEGSFFTHALVSGLLGAADRDRDGSVILEEAYRYAYDATRRATSRTLVGTQHPSFRYDFRGSGDIVLTRPSAHATTRTRLLFPAGMSFLVLRSHAEGAVVAELSADAPHRSLSVAPGEYFVRGRGADVLFEGSVTAHPGASYPIDTAALQRIEYARLVRKGERREGLAHGPELGAHARSALPNESSACLGGFAGYAIELPHFGLRARASGCAGAFANHVLSAATTAWDVELTVLRAWDMRWLSLGLGLGGGATFWNQRFSTRGDAPSRSSASPFFAVSAGVGRDLGGGFKLALDVAAETHFLRLQHRDWEAPRTTVGFALRPTLRLGKYF